MEADVQQFCDGLVTAADIDAAYQAMRDVESNECHEAIVAYAESRGFIFTADDARRWLAAFVASIHDSDLRSRWRMSRLRHINDWASFIALERELKITIPDESYLGNPWHIDPTKQPTNDDGDAGSRFVTRCLHFCFGRSR